MSHDNEPEQKLCTVIEIRYKCEVIGNIYDNPELVE